MRYIINVAALAFSCLAAYTAAAAPEIDLKSIIVKSKEAGQICNINQEYIDNMLKDFNIVKYDQAAKGYTSKKHIAQDKTALIGRLDKNQKLVAASTYSTQTVAEYVIKNGLQQDKAKIISWVNSNITGNILKLEYTTSQPVGYAIIRENLTQVDSTNAVIILRKDGKCAFKILTSYPKSVISK